MGVISGVAGVVNGSAGVRSWSISYAGNAQDYSTSGTSGAKSRIVGNTDWSGSYSAYGGTPVVLPGEALSFIGTVEAGTDKEGATGTAIVDEVAITVDIESGRPIEHTVAFSANGALSLANATATAGADEILPSIGCKLEATTEVTDIRTMTLTIRREAHAYASSGTAGIMKRVVGNLDVEVSFSCYTDDFSALPEVGSVDVVKFYVSAATFWEITSIIWAEPQDMEVAIEDGSPVGASLTGHFVARQGAVVGTIKTPDTETWWPPA